MGMTNESGLREKIAAVIEPSAFQPDRWKNALARMLRFQEDALSKADAIMALIPPDSGVVVPVEPTREQQLAMNRALLDNWPKLIGGDVCVNGRLIDAVYAAALSAAPRGMEG